VAFADYAVREVQAKRVAIIYGEFGSITASAEYAQRVLDRAGVETQLVPFPILSTDLAPFVNAAVAGDPDAIVILAADASCKPAFQSILASGTDATVMYTGACAAPTILDSVDADATEGSMFNVEGPINPDDPSPDSDLYTEVIATYGKGMDSASIGTVSFRSFMNLYMVLREIGFDALSPATVIEALGAKVEAPGFMGHDYTCDRNQFEGLPAVCSPQQVLAVFSGGALTQVGDWVEVGDIYAAS
jgi:branched-chain amino acid transport system substrate-binding protein